MIIPAAYRLTSCQVWWCFSVNPALADQEFRTSLGYMVRPHVSKGKYWAGETAQQGKTLTVKPEDLILICWTHMVEGKN